LVGLLNPLSHGGPKTGIVLKQAQGRILHQEARLSEIASAAAPTPSNRRIEKFHARSTCYGHSHTSGNR